MASHIGMGSKDISTGRNERMNEYALLDALCADFRAVLGDKLAGFYAHGSIAFGCFRWETGDIDFLAVAKSPLTQA